METRTFSAVVRVDGTNVNPITIITEPPVEGRPLAELTAWLTPVRADLKDGTYSLTLAAPEDGLRGEGPDQRTLGLMRQRLFEPMAALQGDLGEAYAFAALDDPSFVDAIGDALGGSVAHAFVVMPSDRFTPGFLSLTVAADQLELSRGMVQLEVDVLGSANVPPEHRAQVDALLANAARQGITPRPDMRSGTCVMVMGAHSRNPFAKGGNAKLQTRLDRLAPAIEAKVMAFVIEIIELAHERSGSMAADIRARFNLS